MPEVTAAVSASITCARGQPRDSVASAHSDMPSFLCLSIAMLSASSAARSCGADTRDRRRYDM